MDSWKVLRGRMWAVVPPICQRGSLDLAKTVFGPAPHPLFIASSAPSPGGRARHTSTRRPTSVLTVLRILRIPIVLPPSPAVETALVPMISGVLTSCGRFGAVDVIQKGFPFGSREEPLPS